ncbi:hypothetical protein J4Q44_G00011340 [Coregonus suidteri]|uniref:Uncharacterized protein n=1 Tax=Coregonus suidteri TaxID=861788 RepID=A0AAN8ML11_9TELE
MTRSISSTGTSSLHQAIPQFLSPEEQQQCGEVEVTSTVEPLVCQVKVHRQLKQASPRRHHCEAQGGDQASHISSWPMVNRLRAPVLDQGDDQVRQGGGEGESSTRWSVPRPSSAMFFTKLDDSSLMTETSIPSPSSYPERSPTGRTEAQEEPLIHGHSIPEYQQIYHSVVDSMLVTASVQPPRYSLNLGRRIKQRLWEALWCPTFTITQLTEGRVGVEETLGVRHYAPQIDVDISLEPKCQQSQRKRAKH